MTLKEKLKDRRFIEDLKISIASGIETDYAYNGEYEIPFNTINIEWSLQQVIKTLQKHIK